jgi:thiol:disulfide interchange protein DsbC
MLRPTKKASQTMIFLKTLVQHSQFATACGAGIAIVLLAGGLMSAAASKATAQGVGVLDTSSVKLAMGKPPAPANQPNAAPPNAVATNAATPTAAPTAPAQPAAAAPANNAAPVSAENLPDYLKTAVEKWLGGRYKVDGVVKTPMPGLWEARIGTDLIYVDEKANFVFADGQLIDIKANVNLTEARVEQLLRVNFDDLPLKFALKQVQGNGKRRLVVFEDPNCPHCRNTRMAINQLQNTTVYTFTYPILRQDSADKVNKALCAKDQMQAWSNLMLEGKVPDNDGKCKNNLKEVVELGRKLRVTGTPTLIFSDGKRVPSGMNFETLNKMMDQHSKG